jgi:F-type H+-transporting ATPase subunit delta
MNAGIISTRYAKAIYRFAAGKSEATLLYKEMKTLSRQFAEFPELKTALGNPILSRKEKIRLLTAAATTNSTTSETAKNVFRVVVGNGRQQYMQQIALVYGLVYRKENNIALARLTTAVEASEHEKQQVATLVSNGGQYQVDFAAKTDPNIIGGFILEVDDLRLDASVKNQLRIIESQLRG